MNIIFESHSTTIDNEKNIASGHKDVELSQLGQHQTKELGKRYANENFDAVFCSNLQRSYKTAEIAFKDRNILITKDARLRECDYGDLTQHSEEEVKRDKPNRITKPFPNGESYEQAANRMKNFLKDLVANYDGKKVMIIGHRATQYGIEHWINNVSLIELVTAPWHWQPGWIYRLDIFAN